MNVKAISRFKILEKSAIDGYDIARTTRLEDLDPEDTPNPELLLTQLDKCRVYITKLLGSMNPEARLYFDRKYGVIPDFDFSWWLCGFVPVDPYILVKVLGMESLGARLGVLCTWLENACSESV